MFFRNPDTPDREFWILPWPDRSQKAPFRCFSQQQLDLYSPHFDWLPDARNIIASKEQGLVIGDTRTGGMRVLTAPAAFEAQPSISPDGKRMVLARSSVDYNIIEVRLDGSAPRPWLSSPRQEHSPSWSRSRKLMAFGTDRRGEQEVWLRDGEGEWERPVVSRDIISEDQPRLVVPSLRSSPSSTN